MNAKNERPKEKKELSEKIKRVNLERIKKIKLNVAERLYMIKINGQALNIEHKWRG